jgi:hypothetical protein
VADQSMLGPRSGDGDEVRRSIHDRRKVVGCFGTKPSRAC